MRLTAIVLLASFALPVGANEDAEAVAREARRVLAAPEQYTDPAIAEKAREVLEAAKARHGQALDGIVDEAAAIADAAFAAEQERQGVSIPGQGAGYRIFISQAMPRGELAELATLSRERGDVTLVLRGLLPGQTLKDLQALVWDLSQPVLEGGSAPAIVIDPRPFSELGITHAPVLARDGEDGAPLLMVPGTTNLTWFEERLASGARGRFDAAGPTVEVAERDMEEVLRESLAKVDAEALKERMQASARSFWQRAPLLDLPAAATTRERQVDPSFVVTQTITTPDGTVLAFEGERVNPLDRIPFHERLIVIDATVPAQVAFAKRVLADGSPLRNTLIITRLDRERGWDAYSEAVVDFDRPVYVLTEAMRATYHLQHVPSLVTAEAGRFVVREIGPLDLEGSHAAAAAPTR